VGETLVDYLKEGAIVTIADINEEKINEVGKINMPKFTGRRFVQC
jgi:leucine dehydrogenase